MTSGLFKSCLIYEELSIEIILPSVIHHNKINVYTDIHPLIF